jgi:hypothetical protein
MTATPDANSSFSGWSGACSGIGSCVIPMDAAKNVTATFTAISAAIGDATVTEGNGGTTPASFTVSLSSASTHAVSVAFATVDGTATAGSDYQAGGGTVAFAPGETTKTVTIDVLGDTAVEPDETFSVNLSSPVGAAVARAQGIGTILNDDSPAPPPARCVVPKLKGKTLAQAARALRAAHCALGKVARAYSKTKSGRVIGQKPPAGRTLKTGAKVNVTLSKGPKPKPKKH